MKEELASRVAFFNRRVLVGSGLSLAGAILALRSHGRSGGCCHWYTNEYYDNVTFDWRTRIGSFKF